MLLLRTRAPATDGQIGVRLSLWEPKSITPTECIGASWKDIRQVGSHAHHYEDRDFSLEPASIFLLDQITQGIRMIADL